MSSSVLEYTVSDFNSDLSWSVIGSHPDVPQEGTVVAQTGVSSTNDEPKNNTTPGDSSSNKRHCNSRKRNSLIKSSASLATYNEICRKVSLQCTKLACSLKSTHKIHVGSLFETPEFKLFPIIDTISGLTLLPDHLSFTRYPLSMFGDPTRCIGGCTEDDITANNDKQFTFIPKPNFETTTGSSLLQFRDLIPNITQNEKDLLRDTVCFVTPEGPLIREGFRMETYGRFIKEIFCHLAKNNAAFAKSVISDDFSRLFPFVSRLLFYCNLIQRTLAGSLTFMVAMSLLSQRLKRQAQSSTSKKHHHSSSKQQRSGQAVLRPSLVHTPENTPPLIIAFTHESPPASAASSSSEASDDEETPADNNSSEQFSLNFLTVMKYELYLEGSSGSTGGPLDCNSGLHDMHRVAEVGGSLHLKVGSKLDMWDTEYDKLFEFIGEHSRVKSPDSLGNGLKTLLEENSSSNLWESKEFINRLSDVIEAMIPTKHDSAAVQHSSCALSSGGEGWSSSSVSSDDDEISDSLTSEMKRELSAIMSDTLTLLLNFQPVSMQVQEESPDL